MAEYGAKDASGKRNVSAGFVAQSRGGGNPQAGPQEHGPASPAHGAAGGASCDFGMHGANPTKIRLGESGGGSKFNPALGG